MKLILNNFVVIIFLYFSIVALHSNGIGGVYSLDPDVEGDVLYLSISFDGDKLCFVTRNDSGEYILWVANSDGRNARPLSVDSGSIHYPKWSPDGEAIAYRTLNKKSFDLWQIAINETEPSKVSDGSTVMSYDWSPDSREVVWESHRGGNANLVVSRKEGSKGRQITFSGLHDRNPKWSPSGDWIAFRSNRNVNQSIWIISPKGEGERQLTSDERYYSIPQWSPDGSRLVAAARSGRQGPESLWIIDLEKGEEPLMVDGDSHRDPQWSPDGKSIFFLSNRGGGNNYWEILIDSRELRRVSRDGVGGSNLNLADNGGKLVFLRSSRKQEIIIRDLESHKTSPRNFGRRTSVSPNGKLIAYGLSERGNFDIWISPFPDISNECRRITTYTGTDDSRVAWSPDSKKIAYVSHRKSLDVWVANVEEGGGDPYPLASDERDDYFPQWSPDGKWITFLSERNLSNAELWLYSVRDKEMIQITSGMHCYSHAWAPDAGSIIYAAGSKINGKLNLFRFDLSTRKSTVLDSEGFDNKVVFSPDGSSFAFLRAENEWDIFLYNIVSGTIDRLTQFNGMESSLVWARDGRSLYFSAYSDKGSGIHRIDISTKRVERIIEGDKMMQCLWIGEHDDQMMYNLVKYSSELYARKIDPTWGRETE